MIGEDVIRDVVSLLFIHFEFAVTTLLDQALQLKLRHIDSGTSYDSDQPAPTVRPASEFAMRLDLTTKQHRKDHFASIVYFTIHHLMTDDVACLQIPTSSQLSPGLLMERFSPSVMIRPYAGGVLTVICRVASP